MIRLLIVLALHVSGVVSGKCSATLVAPCSCESETDIFCYDTTRTTMLQNVNGMQKMFETISINTKDEDKHFGEIYLSTQRGNITELPSDIFQDITFTRIVIDNIPTLKKISSTAFRYSNPYVQTYLIQNTPIDIPSNDYNIFYELSSMHNLQQVTLKNTSLTAILENAFQKIVKPQNSLATIEIIGNTVLNSLGSNAFNVLTNLTLLNMSGNGLKQLDSYSFNITNSAVSNITITIILSNNKIELIGEKSFYSNLSMNIDLSKNNLNASSFSADAFTNISKPSIIKLADNHNLKYLNQSLFERALLAGHQFSLDRTVLTCDCTMNWILQKRSQYAKQILSAICTDGYDLFDEDREESIQCS